MARKQKELEEIIICACHSPEHQLLIRTIDGDDDVYLSMYLVPLSFFKRLRYGLKYIFGYRCKYGAFDEIIITREHVGKIEKIVRWLNTNHNSIK